ncbi:M14 family metallopeptidase [Psychrosphaera aquimarina]|uniref:M14 family metallopeptidase n=1 Tax=Psychrosphaera aquimarina TaxID=2044854 RepID=A0ABU3QXJ2_9GAMM|nr:M14 family metallopeptidase [Psychrosphaera aquimarina]MDU0112157.1 M14 family metallopeptidase [Psychrosphaera aquimarina]
MLRFTTKCFITISLILSVFAATAVELNFYLPKEKLNENIPTPESVLGYQVGDWHVRHDQLVMYFKVLAQHSDRVSLKVIGKSHEQRELLQVTITSSANHNKLDSIQQQHIARLSSSKKPNSDTLPLVVNLNYSVHGDESSGSNASLLVAYYLAASNNPEVLKYLDKMVILLDPSLNPDGLSRFAQWANQHKGHNLNADPNNREHVQDWIRGRVNHYWFDLNRDWLLLQHPESQARIAQYHQWRPNVLTDHHEMGPHSTFFFQPGISSRKNPLTPDKNVELTKRLATFHADAFDEQNKLYFTEESFDDFYAGKGSTYPDLHGTIGILFEQASSRGHLQESINGLLDFPTTIKHQVMASLSTLKGSLVNKNDLLDFQYEFSQQYKELAKEIDFDGYILSEQDDKTRFYSLLSLLQQHDIEVYPLSKNTEINGRQYNQQNSVYIPLKQPQIRIIQSVFSTRKSFNDNTFYDVSSWNLAMAFNITFDKVESKRKVKLVDQEWQRPERKAHANILANYSYAIDWADYHAPALTYALLNANFKVRAALKPFTAKTPNGVKQFAAGTMLINAGLQHGDWVTMFNHIVKQFSVPVSAITSGLTPTGIDLGSRNMMPVYKPNVLVVGGFGTNSYEVGETWYLFDKQLGFSPTIIEKRWLSKTDLDKYTHIIMTDGSYSKDDDSLIDKLKVWTKAGGVLWSQKRTALWLAKNGVLKSETLTQKEMNERFDKTQLNYSDMESIAGKQRIAGAFFNLKLDLSHPLAFGYNKPMLPVFKNRTDLLVEGTNPFTNVAKYTDAPLIAGYADETNVNEIANASGLVAHKYGKGVVIGMTDNPNFRSIMYGTNKLMFNALFLGKAIEAK